MRLNRAQLLFFVALPLFFLPDAARASWLIEPGRMHASAHGQVSCHDCHERIGEGGPHPNPSDVNRTRSGFFQIEQCLSCHDDILEKLETGTHGTKKVSDGGKYRNCIRCHRPHEEPRREDVREGRYDPSRPPQVQCGTCHEPRSELPKLSMRDQGCMGCHQAVDPLTQEGKERLSRLCLHCHGRRGTQAQKMTGEKVRLIDVIAYQSVPHEKVACTICHPSAAAFNHGNQQPADCGQCHEQHDEKVAHDAHLLVSCGACHLEDVAPVRDTASRRILWERIYHAEEPSRIHSMRRGGDEASCARCHIQGNAVGAAAMTLPAKGVLCMPCHAATFSAGDATSIISLCVFFAGILMMFSYWLSGSLPGREDAGPVRKALSLFGRAIRSLFSARIGGIARAFFVDVLLQMRLYRQSEGRWIIHGLIFWPFVLRFMWGLIALIGSLWAPAWPGVWILLDKNHPMTAFFFDVSGVMVLAGVSLAFVRGLLRDATRPQGLVRQDRLALGMIGTLVAVGFVLEGMRIAMTGTPQGSEYAFVGYWLGGFFGESSGLTDIYGYVWYLHALLTGAFVAYIPFSGLMHVIIAPVVLAMRGAERHPRGHL